MQEIERLYEQLNITTDDNFYQLEADLFMAFQSIPDEKKPQPVVAFLTISNWQGTSLRSGVWTFYEAANLNDLTVTTKYLAKTGQTELADIFAKGIHDYQNPKYAKDYNYPAEWIKEADLIDSWIFKHEEWLLKWKRNLLAESKDTILELE